MSAPFAELPSLNLLLSLAWGGYLVALAVWILMQKREPAATLGWLLVLAWLPVVGFLIYHLLGPQRVQRQRLRRLRSRTAVGSGPQAPCGPDAGALARLAQATDDIPPSTATRVTLLPGGTRKFDALLDAIAQARQTLHVEYYIFEPDATGTLVRDALVAAAGRGVRVRLLLDAMGSARLGRGFLAPLRAAGVELAWFHPLRLRRLSRPLLNLRNHRKLVVIDGRAAFVGGINICDDGNERLSAGAYHDLHLAIEGAVVRWLQLGFVEDWHYATGVPLRDASLWPELEDGPIRTQVLASGPDTAWEPIHRVQVSAIHGAQQRVWLATPYFVPGEAARMALTSAALRGVDVRVLLPRMSDSRFVTYAARSYYDELLDAGVRIFEYLPRMLHSKALVVDGQTAFVGSANFDHRSFRLNFELGVLLYDRDVAAALEALLERDMGDSREVPRQRERHGYQHFLEAGARLFSPLL